MQARGLPKNLAITLLILSPLAAVSFIIWWIFTSLSAGPAMDAGARGQGASDTGGANAIGELLAGNDPDEIQRTNRALRSGEPIDPALWPGGITFTIIDPGLPATRRPSLGFHNGRETSVSVMQGPNDGVFTLTVDPGEVDPGSLVLVGINGLSIDPGGPSVDGEGNAISPAAIDPVSISGADRTEPIIVDLNELGFRLK
ncbi:MAG: hypothetical protein AAGI53_03570 [Planctomycetota bacterium]